MKARRYLGHGRFVSAGIHAGKMMRLRRLPALTAALLAAAPCGADGTTAWVERVSLPTRDISRMMYRSPPFGPRLHASTTECFPYPVWDRTAGDRQGALEPVDYDSVVVSNGLLRVVLLPGIGGRLWRATDLRTDREWWVSGQTIKPKGLWKTGNAFMRSTGGVRFDFPEWGHDPSAEQPWSYRLLNGDGYAGVYMAYTNLRSRLAIAETVLLCDASAAIEIKTALHNPNAQSRRFKYWTIDYVPVDASSYAVVPADFVVDHAGERTWSWPVDRGRDLSRFAAWPPDTSYFALARRGGFAAVLSPDAGTGLVRVFPADIVPGVKFYADRDAGTINTYGGAARTMEEWRELAPGATLEWTEFRYAVDGLTGLTTAGAGAAMQVVTDGTNGAVTVRVLASVTLRDARVSCRMGQEQRAAFSDPFSLAVGEIHEAVFEAVSGHETEIEIRLLTASSSAPILVWHGTPEETAESGAGTDPTPQRLVNGSFETLTGDERPAGWQRRIGESRIVRVTRPGLPFERVWSLALDPNDRPCFLMRGPKWRKRPVRCAVAGTDGETTNLFGESGDGPGQYFHPLGLDVDAEGRFYVVDTGNHRVLVFDAEGRYVRMFGRRGSGPGEFDGPGCLALADDGHVLVTDIGNARVLEFDAEGRPVGTPVGHEDLVFPFDIVLDDRDRLIVADTGDASVKIFRRDGTAIAVLGRYGTEPGRFLQPALLAVGREGRIFVADTELARISVFDRDGRLERIIGPRPDARVPFARITGLAVDSRNRLLVMDALAENPIVMYSVTGESLGHVPLIGVGGKTAVYAGHADCVSLDGKGGVYVSTTNRRDLDMLSRHTSEGLVWQSAMHGAGTAQFDRIGKVAVDSGGRAWALDRSNARLHVFEADGRYVSTVERRDSRQTWFAQPVAVAIGPRGRLYVSDSVEGAVFVVSPDTGDVERRLVADARFHPGSLTVTPGGRVWVHDTPNRRLAVFGPDGKLTRFVETNVDEQKPAAVRHLVCDPDGRVLLLDRSNGRLLRFDAAGRRLPDVRFAYADRERLFECVDFGFDADGRLILATRLERGTVVALTTFDYTRAGRVPVDVRQGDIGK